jgi:50S ribosomal protein L16 3-hydroxylase
MPVLESLGDLSVDQFMRRHWQRAPLLVRRAIPAFAPPIDRAGLVALARRDDVESRLVTAFDGRWSMRRGPFERLPPRRRPGWTLLVQGVDAQVDAAHALLRRFAFVPEARLDDLMVSVASDGGGVGPHVDSYDVFLLQSHGRRRWRIAPPGDATLVDGLPVKLLAHFRPTQEWVLEPGDLLYLPPGWGHDGVAEGECITCSIGFRAPSRHEFLAAFLADAADAPGGAAPRFGDRGRPRTAHPAAGALGERLATDDRAGGPLRRPLPDRAQGDRLVRRARRRALAGALRGRGRSPGAGARPPDADRLARRLGLRERRGGRGPCGGGPLAAPARRSAGAVRRRVPAGVGPAGDRRDTARLARRGLAPPRDRVGASGRVSERCASKGRSCSAAAASSPRRSSPRSPRARTN